MLPATRESNDRVLRKWSACSNHRPFGLYRDVQESQGILYNGTLRSIFRPISVVLHIYFKICTASWINSSEYLFRYINKYFAEIPQALCIHIYIYILKLILCYILVNSNIGRFKYFIYSSRATWKLNKVVLLSNPVVIDVVIGPLLVVAVVSKIIFALIRILILRHLAH